MSLSGEESYYEPVYTIGHAAKKVGVSVPTLRMYEQEGLILAFRTATNRRLYSRHDINHLKQIVDLIRNKGLNIESIRRLAAIIPCWRLTKCPKEICEQCIGYEDNVTPCWNIPDAACKKFSNNCRTCDVYLTFPQCLQDPKRYYKSSFE